MSSHDQRDNHRGSAAFPAQEHAYGDANMTRNKLKVARPLQQRNNPTIGADVAIRTARAAAPNPAPAASLAARGLHSGSKRSYEDISVEVISEERRKKRECRMPASSFANEQGRKSACIPNISCCLYMFAYSF